MGRKIVLTVVVLFLGASVTFPGDDPAKSPTAINVHILSAYFLARPTVRAAKQLIQKVLCRLSHVPVSFDSRLQ